MPDRVAGPAQLAYSQLLRELRPTLAHRGFAGRRLRFERATPESVEVIEFQQSDKSHAEEVIFTINLGVYSLVIAETYGEEEPQTLTCSSCHWQERVGFLFDEPKDHWWIIDHETDLSRLATTVEGALVNVAFSKLDALGSAAALLEEFLAGRPRALSLPERIVNMLALIEALGAQDLLRELHPEIEKARRGQRGRRFIDQHIARLSLDLQT